MSGYSVIARRGPDKTRRELVTPEGVALGLKLADAGERAGAFLIDTMIVFFTILLLVWLVAKAGIPDGWTQAFLAVLVFALTNFYYMFFELRWLGATPGKRALGLRVVDRKGGQLTAEAIVARNLMRQVEFWIPLTALLAPEAIFGEGPGWVQLVASLWLFILVLMPLFNKDRLRVGDMVGGTMVVYRPKAVLLPDIGAEADKVSIVNPGRVYEFSDAQLKVYGIYELQVLEDVLRKSDGIDRIQSLSAVAYKIKVKIGWPQQEMGGDPEKFLRDFYVALRAHLEKNMLFGKRVTDKFSAQRGPKN
ncbi:MAG: RDD family protein [Deltaproteobacteria bacterium]|nr:RDD family protein [Deltaproteobacteria bacterium]